MAQALLRAGDEVVVREDAGDGRAGFRRPDAILRRHLGGDVDFAPGGARRIAHQLLAMAIAVRQRDIDQADREIDGAAQGEQRFIVRAAEPLFAADAPGAVADVADSEVSPSPRVILHTLSLVRVHGGTDDRLLSSVSQSLSGEA